MDEQGSARADRTTVVVVGGGYAGVNVAKALDEHASVVLIEPKDAFVHAVGALRGLVDAEFLPRIFLPYDRLLAHGRVVHDRAVEVDAQRVVLGSGEVIDADFVVLASGSTYPFPAKSDAPETGEATAHYRAARARLEQAERVLLVGAGPVGIELAGEILSKWPQKSVMLFDIADDVLGERFRTDLRAELRSQLVDAGVEVVLGDPLDALPPTPPTELQPFTVRTQSGREISADIWFRCFGVTPVSDYLQGELATARGADGFIAVTPTMQVVGQRNVFAVGDVSNADSKMAGLASRQAKVVADNILKMLLGDDDLEEYASFGPAIIVPIGPDGGSGQLPGQDELASREFVSTMKGRDLMVDRFAEMLGLEAPVV